MSLDRLIIIVPVCGEQYSPSKWENLNFELYRGMRNDACARKEYRGNMYVYCTVL
jgi:hypothetical protein